MTKQAEQGGFLRFSFPGPIRLLVFVSSSSL